MSNKERQASGRDLLKTYLKKLEIGQIFTIQQLQNTSGLSGSSVENFLSENPGFFKHVTENKYEVVAKPYFVEKIGRQGDTTGKTPKGSGVFGGISTGKSTHGGHTPEI